MRKLLEIANSVEPVQDDRIHIEKNNGPFQFPKSRRYAANDLSTQRIFGFEWK